MDTPTPRKKIEIKKTVDRPYTLQEWLNDFLDNTSYIKK